ncbi:MAG: PEP-CTERM sorting domain-containing protein [Verrucomicrobiaceae bacterium]|nr:PEP-CTERM sorting domain-containing protein [Verrucomicrobiaceae bacterium]
MKHLVALIFFLVLAAQPSRAVIVYSGIQDIPVPNTNDGVYLNIATGAATGTYPADWNSKPYFNPFYGGVAIATSDLFLPVITGADQVLNLPFGSLIDPSLSYTTGESGSGTHVGGGAGQFTLAFEGYVGYKFKTTISGPEYYGWARIVIENSGSGLIRDWAYNDSDGIGILTGMLLEAPEPGRTSLLFAAVACAALRRRRSRL